MPTGKKTNNIMSLLYKNRDYYLIDHREFITKVYKNIIVSENELISFSILAELFSIINVEKNQTNKKRTRYSDNLHQEVRYI